MKKLIEKLLLIFDLAILNGYEFDHDYAILDDLICALSNAMR